MHKDSVPAFCKFFFLAGIVSIGFFCFDPPVTPLFAYIPGSRDAQGLRIPGLPLFPSPDAQGLDSHAASAPRCGAQRPPLALGRPGCPRLPSLL